jgi:hypothetical protein
VRKLLWLPAIVLYCLAAGGLLAALHGDGLFSLFIAAGLTGGGWATQRAATKAPRLT